MIIKKDSLLFRIITYNGLAIILVSSIMAVLFSVLMFNELNSRLLEKARERIVLLEKAYDLAIEESEDDLFNAVSNSLDLQSLSKGNFSVQNNLAAIIKNQLNIESYSQYKNSYIQIISPQKKLIEESGNNLIKNDLINENLLMPDSVNLENRLSYFIGSKTNLYVRIINSFRSKSSFEENYVVLTVPISNFNLDRVRDFVDLEEEKIFVLLNNKYIYGDFNIEKDIEFLKISRASKLDKIFAKNKYYFSEKKIDKTPFYMGIVSLTKNELENRGSVGIAISKNNFLIIRYMMATIILVICLLSVIVSTTLCARMFTKLLYPLSILADKTKEIGDNSEIDFEEEKVYEIRSISNSLKSLNRKVKENEELLLKKNESLNINLSRIIAVESVLMRIDIDKEFSESIVRILEALTSEIGLGYSRAIYMEYDEESNLLVAKKALINPNIISNVDIYAKDMRGFRFQIKDLENMLPLLKVKYETGNLFWESMNSKKIIYFNDKGYKYNFGNELFKTLGISNFLILPISDKDLKIGCILIDYFAKERIISDEEVEVIKLLLMNVIVRIKNYILEDRKLNRERISAITQNSNRFLNDNDKLLNKLERDIEKIVNNGYNYEDIENMIKYIKNEKKQIKFMKRILNDSERKFKVINLEKIVKKALKDIEPTISKNKIDLSLFFNYSGNILGDRIKIYQMLFEILKNSINAIMIRNKLDKKINILIESTENNKIILEIIDNGIGMTREELIQFDKLYLDIGNSKMGLGLMTVYNTVKEHNGLIKIISTLDEGTKVRIIFNEYKEDKK